MLLLLLLLFGVDWLSEKKEASFFDPDVLREATAEFVVSSFDQTSKQAKQQQKAKQNHKNSVLNEMFSETGGEMNILRSRVYVPCILLDGTQVFVVVFM